MTKQDKIEQRLLWIEFKLRSLGYSDEFVNWEMDLLRENEIGQLADVTCNIITDSPIYEQFATLPTVLEVARESKMRRK